MPIKKVIISLTVSADPARCNASYRSKYIWIIISVKIPPYNDATRIVTYYQAMSSSNRYGKIEWNEDTSRCCSREVCYIRTTRDQRTGTRNCLYGYLS